jgi:hypothetical protein
VKIDSSYPRTFDAFAAVIVPSFMKADRSVVSFCRSMPENSSSTENIVAADIGKILWRWRVGRSGSHSAAAHHTTTQKGREVHSEAEYTKLNQLIHSH